MNKLPRKYPGDPHWRSRSRAPGGGRPHKWRGWGKMVRINANWPARLKARLVEQYGSEQAAVDALVIEPTVASGKENVNVQNHD